MTHILLCYLAALIICAACFAAIYIILKKAFKIGPYDVKLSRVLLVDDIFTTGSTVDAAAAVLKEAGADNAVLTLKSLEAFEKAADGKATKIIVPSKIQEIAGLVKSITEVAADGEAQKE